MGKDTTAWHGLESVICQRGNAVYVHANGEVKKVAACRVKPCELKERKLENKEEQEKKGEEEDENGEKEEIGEEDMVMTEDGLKDVIGAKYLKVANSVYFLDTSVYVVEVPVRDHGKPEVMEAKEKEIQNLETYETFEEIEDKGREAIGK